MHRSPDGSLRSAKDTKAAGMRAPRGRKATPKCPTAAGLLSLTGLTRPRKATARPAAAAAARGPRAAAALRVGLLIPLSGPAGIWGPSAHKCATLAVDEINDGGGVLGREIRLVLSDAGRAPDAVAAAARDLVEQHGVEAFIGMHISAVRVAVARALKGRVPFVYTPLYEGGERSPGVFAVGETPEQQLKPAVTWLAERRRARRWYLLGNDYVWPRVSHAAAKHYIVQSGGEVVGEEYVPLGCDEFAPSLARIRAARPHAVLISLVGGDGVAFHRRFAAEGMAGDYLRLSSALDENSLLGVGAENTENLFAASGYFEALPTRANQAFIERYQQSFGALAPVLSALGQSCYEGFRFYAALARRAASLDAMALEAAAASFEYEGARGTVRMRDKRVVMANYLAQADGLGFRIIDHLS
jgi:urea transport system substrate-binding protein